MQWFIIIWAFYGVILLQDGPAYVRVFVTILQEIFKEDTVEYVLALIDEMLAGKCGEY